MTRIVERLPQLTSASVLLAGAMLFGASLNYAYNNFSTVAFAEMCGQACDAEDPDDCPSGCTCNDPIGGCVGPLP
jgi:hypothetical protein